MILDFRVLQRSRRDRTDNPGAPIASAGRVYVPPPLSLLVVAVLASPLEAAQLTVDDREYCAAYGDSDVVVLGRPQAPVVIRFSGERVIARARQELALVEAEVERIRGLLSPQQRLEQDAELDVRVFDAKHQLGTTIAMYPPPMDLPFVPVHVERVLRGMPSAPFMARLMAPDAHLEADQLYLISGRRSTDLLALPEMTDVPLTEYVEVVQAHRAASARRAVRFLHSTASGATILGQIQMESFGSVVDDAALGRPLRGTRISASVAGWRGDVPIDANGDFVIEGVPAGRVELQASLPAGLTLVGPPAPAVDLAEGSCHLVQLTAQRNGRVRGRIGNVSAAARAGITLVLDARIFPGSGPEETIMTSHGYHREIPIQENGGFEFVGVPPGSYALFARYQRTPQTAPPWPVTYFPGTPDLANAIRIEVGSATEHDGLDFTIVLDDATR